ncbi:MAG: SRPBCC domain-containing protein [Bacteroidota bacterium]
MYLVSAEATIRCSREKVWQVLTDFEKYQEWNRFTPTANFKPEVGWIGKLEVRMNLAKEKTAWYPEEVKSWKEGYEIKWGVPHTTWYIQSLRTQRLTEIDEHTTRYRTDELLWGPIAWCTFPFVRKGIQEGFDEVARALKERVESLYG